MARQHLDETLAASGSSIRNSISSTPSFSASYSSSSSFANYQLISPFLAFAAAQFIKLFLVRCKEKRWDFRQLMASGGMPSSHSATVTALAVAVGFQDGFGGSAFAVALVLAFVVMFDAFGVRLHAGQQAEVLNQIVFELPAEHPLADSRPLRELLGHTPSQVVAGGLLGLFMAGVCRLAVFGWR